MEKVVNLSGIIEVITLFKALPEDDQQEFYRFLQVVSAAEQKGIDTTSIIKAGIAVTADKLR